MPALELYYFEECPYCQKVLHYLRSEKPSLLPNIALKNTRTDKQLREELRALNGITQVPCLVIDGKPMLESDDIVAWLRSNC